MSCRPSRSDLGEPEGAMPRAGTIGNRPPCRRAPVPLVVLRNHYGSYCCLISMLRRDLYLKAGTANRGTGSSARAGGAMSALALQRSFVATIQHLFAPACIALGLRL
eukprot:686179-Rhodomonas_salina.4